MIYLALLQNPFMHPVAVSDAIAPGEAVALDLPPSGATADPICGEMLSKLQMPAGEPFSSVPSGQSDPSVTLDYSPAGPSHADQLQQLADLIAANDASCEDDVPLFLRQARRG